LVLNFDEKYIKEYIDILKILRQNNINSELFLDPNIKLLKQFKYAENKGIPLSIII
jgi:histidyl-tRNA synthetase